MVVFGRVSWKEKSPGSWLVCSKSQAGDLTAALVRLNLTDPLEHDKSITILRDSRGILSSNGQVGLREK